MCACIVCLDSDPPPIQSGCACRSDTGLAHVGCLIEKAVAQQPHRGNAVWWECQTCGQQLTGAIVLLGRLRRTTATAQVPRD